MTVELCKEKEIINFLYKAAENLDPGLILGTSGVGALIGGGLGALAKRESKEALLKNILHGVLLGGGAGAVGGAAYSQVAPFVKSYKDISNLSSDLNKRVTRLSDLLFKEDKYNVLDNVVGGAAVGAGAKGLADWFTGANLSPASSSIGSLNPSDLAGIKIEPIPEPNLSKIVPTETSLSSRQYSQPDIDAEIQKAKKIYKQQLKEHNLGRVAAESQSSFYDDLQRYLASKEQDILTRVATGQARTVPKEILPNTIRFKLHKILANLVSLAPNIRAKTRVQELLSSLMSREVFENLAKNPQVYEELAKGFVRTNQSSVAPIIKLENYIRKTQGLPAITNMPEYIARKYVNLGGATEALAQIRAKRQGVSALRKLGPGLAIGGLLGLGAHSLGKYLNK